MPHYDSTARVPFKHGGSVKKPKVKRIILWKGKAKDWPGAKKAAEELRNKKAEGGRIEFKKGKAVTKADTARSDLWRKRQLKKRADVKRKSKWDVYGGIAAHPLNPFQMHAQAKAYDFTKKQKDTYKRTRDKLKKSKDPGVKGIGEAFQKMDRKDEAKKKKKAEGGIISLKKGGKADKKWIQKATKGMRKDKPCTGKKFGSATCPPGSKRYNLAQTFKKMARSKHASGGLVRYI